MEPLFEINVLFCNNEYPTRDKGYGDVYDRTFECIEGVEIVRKGKQEIVLAKELQIGDLFVTVRDNERTVDRVASIVAFSKE